MFSIFNLLAIILWWIEKGGLKKEDILAHSLPLIIRSPLTYFIICRRNEKQSFLSFIKHVNGPKWIITLTIRSTMYSIAILCIIMLIAFNISLQSIDSLTLIVPQEDRQISWQHPTWKLGNVQLENFGKYCKHEWTFCM